MYRWHDLDPEVDIIAKAQAAGDAAYERELPDQYEASRAYTRAFQRRLAELKAGPSTMMADSRDAAAGPAVQ